MTFCVLFVKERMFSNFNGLTALEILMLKFKLYDETMMVGSSNLENNPAYYQEATLSFVVREKEKLFKTYQEFGYFKVTNMQKLQFVG